MARLVVTIAMCNYRGRIAPSPTGYLHAGHAVTFWRAQERARAADGRLILRIEDLDSRRCRPEFRDAIVEDLRWFGLDWDEGPDIGGAMGPYIQSERTERYRAAWQRLQIAGFIYPCVCSRKDVAEAALAPHDETEEPIYPRTCRPGAGSAGPELKTPDGVHWRFRVQDGETLQFVDAFAGKQIAVAGKDFGDFIIWRKDGIPSYQLAVVVDDIAMGITEVVRGQDLLRSTFRQLLIYRAVGAAPPAFCHTPLVVDESGKRLAKRNFSLSLRHLRATGVTPEEIRDHYL